MLTKEQLLEKSKKPSADALKMLPFFKGKIMSTLKCAVRSFDDFAIWYTPGVATACMDIKAHPEKVFEHTNKANMVATVSDGTRVLGLGDIGPEAAIPVSIFSHGTGRHYEIRSTALAPALLHHRGLG